MATTSDYLAFDLGASSGRAVLGRFDGKRIALEEVHRFENGPVRILDQLRWNVADLFTQIKTGLAACAAQNVTLDGVGIDTWGVDFGLLSREGELLGLPYHYRDRRTRGLLDEAFKRIPRSKLYAATGIQFMELNTAYQLLAASIQTPDLLAAADKLLFMPDLLNYWLTGRAQSEYTIASTSQLFLADGHGWASDVIQRLGLPERIFQDVIAPATTIGPLLPGVAEETGLRQINVIAPACHDTGSAVAAVPAQGDDWAYISSGTWSLVGVELADPICNEAALAANFTNEGGVNGTIRFLKNVSGLWLVQEARRSWAAAGEEHSFAELTALAAAAPPQRTFVNPDDPRFAEPGDMPQRIRDYCAETGQPVPADKGALVRCILESLALTYATNLDTIEKLTGRRIGVVHIVGGGCQNKLLCQLTADVTGKPVIAGPAEATAAGNVMIQALANGGVGSLEEVREVVAASTTLEQYEADRSVDWEEARGRFEGIRGHRVE